MTSTTDATAMTTTMTMIMTMATANKELQDVMSVLHSCTVLVNVMNMNMIECMVASIMVMIMKTPLKTLLSISLDALMILG